MKLNILIQIIWFKSVLFESKCLIFNLIWNIRIRIEFEFEKLPFIHKH